MPQLQDEIEIVPTASRSRNCIKTQNQSLLGIH